MIVWEVILDFLERFSKHRAHSLTEFGPYRVISLGVSKRLSNMYIFLLPVYIILISISIKTKTMVFQIINEGRQQIGKLSSQEFT